MLRLAPVHNIGALCLDTQPLKLALRAEAAAWKTQFATNLHAHGKEQLESLLKYVKETTFMLSRNVENLDDVRTVMGIQQIFARRNPRLTPSWCPLNRYTTCSSATR